MDESKRGYANLCSRRQPLPTYSSPRYPARISFSLSLFLMSIGCHSTRKMWNFIQGFEFGVLLCLSLVSLHTFVLSDVIDNLESY